MSRSIQLPMDVLTAARKRITNAFSNGGSPRSAAEAAEEAAREVTGA